MNHEIFTCQKGPDEEHTVLYLDLPHAPARCSATCAAISEPQPANHDVT